MFEKSYWQKKASPWVTATVLVGGLASALILSFISKVENDINNFSSPEDEIIASLEDVSN